MLLRDQVTLRTASLVPALTPNRSQAKPRAWKAPAQSHFSQVHLRATSKPAQLWQGHPGPGVHSLRW